MTKRALLIGLLGAVLVGAGGQYVSKYIPGMTYLIRGHLPLIVFGPLILFVLLANPLLGRIRLSWRLRAAELGIVMAMILVGCGLANFGLLRYFPRALVYPTYQSRVQPGWQDARLLEATPPCLLADGGRYSDEVIDKYVTGMGQKGHPIPITRVPWTAWWKPLLTWGGIILLFMMGVISLSVLVHRQWADRERLRYPIADLAASVLKEDERGGSVMARSRAFWLGVGVFMGIRLINGLHAWFPDVPGIPLVLDFSPLESGFPEFMKTPGADAFANIVIYPPVVCFTFLLASEIGFSLGLSTFLSVFLTYAMIALGLNTSGSDMIPGIMQAQNFGSFLAMGVILVYLGRRTYWQTLKQAVTFRPQAETEPAGVWALRVLIVCAAGLAAILSVVGLDWPLAVLAVLLLLLMFLVLSRLSAECGTFALSPGWQMPAVLVGLFGLNVLDPRLIIILGLVMYVLSMDPFESLMPFVTNGLKIASAQGLRAGRVGAWLACALAATLAVGVPAALWSEYNNGAEMRYGADMTAIYGAAQQNATQLRLSGEFQKVAGYGSLERLAHISPDRNFLVPMIVGALLLAVCGALRLRFAWWPLHPVAVLVVGCSIIGRYWFSFLLGWGIKVVVMKFGGASQYDGLKPLMIGILAGDLLGQFVMMVIGWSYYGVTGFRPPYVPLW